MWSHYANNHGGICVGFDGLSVNSFSGIKLSGKVNYQNELPIVQYFGEEKKRVVHKIFFTKNSDWNYEREFRLVAEADAALTMDPALIREVMLGMNIDGLTEERVRQMVAKRHTAFPVRTAHLSYATYEMEIS